MFKYVMIEFFGPFCGMGGYGSETKIGISNSPQKAILKAKGRINGGTRRTNNENPETGICGGGVPIMLETFLYKDGKLIEHKWS